MFTLNWKKKPKVEQADIQLVNRALKGELKASVQEITVLGDIYQKLDIEDNCNSILPDKIKTVVYKPDKKARRNWGDLYRACVRLHDCGEIAGFTLRRNGQLRVRWSITCKPKIAPIPKNTYDPTYLESSSIPIEEVKEDKRLAFNSRHKAVKLDTTPKFKPYDYAPSRLLIEDRIFKDHAYLHSEEGRIERVRKRIYEEKAGGATDKWAPKFKHNPDYFSDEITARDFDTVFKELCSARGWCAWPSPIYRS